MTFSDMRSGDQKIFISDNRKAMRMLGWKPTVEAKAGIAELFGWIKNNVFESEVFTQPN